MKRTNHNALVTFRVILCLFSIVTIAPFANVKSYVLTQEGATRTYLHKRLIGRQRREIQREILSVLGLHHRPRPSGIRSIEKTSAPLYMLGLYNKVSLDQIGLQTNSLSNNRYDARNWQSGRMPVGLRLTPELDHLLLTPSLNRYIENSEIMSNEVGVFDSQMEPVNQAHRVGTYNNILTNEIETQLLDDSDVVMSFVNTKNHYDRDDIHSSVEHLRNSLGRHRSFYFDISHVTLHDRLTAAKFRLYKEKSGSSMLNITLRINVYQLIQDSHESVGVMLVGSRLVGSNERGWLVFDATSTLRDWINYPNKNMGLKVSVETIDGRNVKPSAAAIVGRNGESSKQAFIVAFFSQNGEMNLMDHVQRRQRRNADLNTERESNENDEMLNENATENHAQQTTEYFLDAEDGLNNNVEGAEGVDGQDENTTTNGRQSNEIGNNNIDVQQKNNAKRGTKKKNRKRKKKKKQHTCGRRDLYVNFQDLNWADWIIAPPGYAAYFCSGECGFPLNAHVNATNHAIVQALVHLLDKKSKPPMPCCSPTALSGMSVLYFADKSNVVYKKYQNMVVQSCGCH